MKSSTMEETFFSIIITILNGGKTIANCLHSISCQTFSNYELIIVDGGSTDNTLQEIEKIEIKNKQIHVIPNIGLYAGLNEGIKHSKGKWLYFIGADDVIYNSEVLEKVYSKIIRCSNEPDVFVGSVACIKQNTLLKPLLGSPYLMRHQVHHQGMFYRRKVFDNNYYDEKMSIASDYEFNLNLSLSNFKHFIMDIIVCNFGGDGISENQMAKGFSEMQRIHKRVLRYPFSLLSMSYFWARRKTGKYLRSRRQENVSLLLKRIFG